MIEKKIDSFLDRHCATMLGVGPMSKNCVDASIELANEYNTPIMLIASRRQIDSEAFGGGYVNNWSTERFSEYVIETDKKGKIILARDHGGPWQNDYEKKQNMSLRAAMQSAKESYRTDIESGFEIIHIDPSVDIHGDSTHDDILDRVFELYEFCCSVAESKGKNIAFEVGTEEQSGGTNTPEELEYVLNSIIQYCSKAKLPRPKFVVVQTGTRVMEMRNVGTFDSPIRVAGELPAEIQVPMMIELCGKYGMYMKQHNTDYLSNEALQWHPKLGIHAANVAPEFGVVETKTFMSLLMEYDLCGVFDDFVQLAVSSNKWQKWMLPNTEANDVEKAMICGHYVFSSPNFVDLKRQAQTVMSSKGQDLDFELKSSVKHSIMRYLKNFRLINQ